MNSLSQRWWNCRWTEISGCLLALYIVSIWKPNHFKTWKWREMEVALQGQMEKFGRCCMWQESLKGRVYGLLVGKLGWAECVGTLKPAVRAGPAYTHLAFNRVTATAIKTLHQLLLSNVQLLTYSRYPSLIFSHSPLHTCIFLSLSSISTLFYYLLRYISSNSVSRIFRRLFLHTCILLYFLL